MMVLAIDTALDACAAAIFDSSDGTIVAADTQFMSRGHAEALMPLIAGVMETAGLRFDRLDRIAVTVGPGSFTGLRVGISAARGIALATGKPAVGITTLAALAAPYIDADPATPVAATIDARHQHVYLQLSGPGGRILLSSRIVPLTQAVHAAAGASACLVGSGARLMADLWPETATAPRIDERRAADIAWVARLGALSDPYEAPPKPLYIRAADAHPQLASVLPRR
jgi:tRNA threonylcarbamoyladenosine biosynthesis protein TsaB